MSSPNKIVLDAPQVKEGNKVYCHFKCLGKANKYFEEDTFYIEMNETVESIPKSILLIPALANICPVAWITGSDIYVEEIDQEFLEALNIIKKSFQRLYPQHSFDGVIKYQEIKKNRGYEKGKSGLFFSGGVDAVTSYIRNQHERPYLLTIWGADIPLSEREGWSQVENNTQKFAKDHELTPLFIKSNLRSFLNEKKLQKDYAKHGVKSWWVSIQHGLGIVGLSAPFSFLKGINKIYFASTPLFSHNNNLYSTPWGSHPSIENNLKWGETQANLDGIGLNRFEKIGVIAEYIKQHEPNLQLRVCWESKKGKNCGVCEKCARTMAGLLSEGLNPSNHGFSINKTSLQSMKKNKKSFSKLNRLQWETIQKKLGNKVLDMNSEYYDFCQLILKTNFQGKRKHFFS
ncbi:hypothetical protein [Priestia megaterium]|uniref:hypothetical protein n=1 Tax=Priestia megaterium TaxID=1404 RepID=UPI003EEB20E2